VVLGPRDRLALAAAVRVAGAAPAAAFDPTPASEGDRQFWARFTGALGRLALALAGPTYSSHPHVVPERLAIAEAASAPEPVFNTPIGACFAVPAIIVYTVPACWVFRGEARALRYAWDPAPPQGGSERRSRPTGRLRRSVQ
jgi:cytochrome bd-type quinol oxidase subunit 2